MHYLFNSDRKATTRKAMPAQRRFPVRNQTTSAIMAAGKMNRRIFAISMIITIPMITKRSSNARSPSVPSEGNWNAVKSKKLTYILHLKSIFKHFQKRQKTSKPHHPSTILQRNNLNQNQTTRTSPKTKSCVKLKYSQTVQSTITLPRRHLKCPQ